MKNWSSLTGAAISLFDLFGIVCATRRNKKRRTRTMKRMRAVEKRALGRHDRWTRIAHGKPQLQWKIKELGSRRPRLRVANVYVSRWSAT
jgi:hypothetical protein